MGSTNFENEYRGTATMQEAYQQLCEAAVWEHGHDPYNGTIATTRGVRQDPLIKEPISREEARIHLYGEGNEQQWWDRDEQPQKWEAAWAIPLKPEPEVDPDAKAVVTNWMGLDLSQPGWLFYGWAAC